MNNLKLYRICIYIIFISLIGFDFVESNTIKPIAFKDGGYESITITISDKVPEDPKILENLKIILKEASQTLWSVSKNRAFFREFNIIVPNHWRDEPDYNSISGYCQDKSDIRVDLPEGLDEPFTQQPGGCGESGEFIFLPTTFITDSQKNKDKTFIHEWAHFRYGVFDEHGIKGDPDYPSFTLSDDGYYVTYSVCVKADGQLESPTDTCEINTRTQQIDPSCTFIPYDFLDMKASLMFKPIQDTMDGFCEDTTNEDYKHNTVKTKHNDKCNGRSVSSVILGHDDFKAKRPNLKSEIVPKINVLKSSNVNSDEIFVLTYDVSGSMYGTRIKVLSKSSQDFIYNTLPDGTKLGLVQFHTYSTALHDIVVVDNNTRQSLYAKVPLNALDMTSIGAGLIEALNMINKYGNYSQATIILISDGEENTYPYINNVIDQFINNSRIRIITYALGDSASDRLEELANKTGGYGLWTDLTDSAEKEAQKVANSLLDIVSSTCDLEIQKIRIYSVYFNMTTKRTTRTVTIDQGLGKNTIFLISSDDINKLIVSFKSPTGIIFDENSTEVDTSDNNKVKLEMVSSDPGNWVMTFEKKKAFESDWLSLSIDVLSQYSSSVMRSSTSYPIILESSISHTEVESSNPPKVFGYLKRGYAPILMASVSATVSRPSGSDVEIKLEDNGIGADAVKNDGIYSAYFTDYTERGRYNVIVSAASDGNAKTRSAFNTKKHKSLNRNHRIIGSVNKTFAISDFKPVLFFSHTNDDTVSVSPFSRVQNAGAFNLKSLPIYDTIPPIRVSDLAISSIDENLRTIDLIWTSAGDDFTTGTAKEIQIRADSDLANVQNDANFGSLFLFTSQQVIQGSLNPLVGGQKHIIKLSVDSFSNGDKFSVHFTLKTIDDNNNVAPKSNIVTAHFGVLPKNTVLYDSINTLNSNAVSKKFDITIKNTTLNGTFIMDIPAKHLSNLKINLKAPNGLLINEKNDFFIKDQINGHIIINYESDLFGVWSLYIQRISMAGAEDINFSIRALTT